MFSCFLFHRWMFLGLVQDTFHRLEDNFSFLEMFNPFLDLFYLRFIFFYFNMWEIFDQGRTPSIHDQMLPGLVQDTFHRLEDIFSFYLCFHRLGHFHAFYFIVGCFLDLFKTRFIDWKIIFLSICIFIVLFTIGCFYSRLNASWTCSRVINRSIYVFMLSISSLDVSWTCSRHVSSIGR